MRASAKTLPHAVCYCENTILEPTSGSLEEFLPHGAKEFDSIFISFNYGNLNFKINSEESLTAFSLDQNKDYYLYIENNDNNAGSKVSIIYIRKKI